MDFFIVGNIDHVTHFSYNEYEEKDIHVILQVNARILDD